MNLDGIPVIVGENFRRDQIIYGTDLVFYPAGPVVMMHPFQLTMLACSPDEALTKNLGALVARAHHNLDDVAQRLGGSKS